MVQHGCAYITHGPFSSFTRLEVHILFLSIQNDCSQFKNFQKKLLLPYCLRCFVGLFLLVKLIKNPPNHFVQACRIATRRLLESDKNTRRQLESDKHTRIPFPTNKSDSRDKILKRGECHQLAQWRENALSECLCKRNAITD